jgi:hypothetical protein
MVTRHEPRPGGGRHLNHRGPPLRRAEPAEMRLDPRAERAADGDRLHRPAVPQRDGARKALAAIMIGQLTIRAAGLARIRPAAIAAATSVASRHSLNARACVTPLCARIACRRAERGSSAPYSINGAAAADVLSRACGFRPADQSIKAGDEPPRLAAQPLPGDGLGAAAPVLPRRLAAPLQPLRRSHAGPVRDAGRERVAHLRPPPARHPQP